jgi:hypothetical protein
VCDPAVVDDVQASIPEQTWIIGELMSGTSGTRTVHFT